jgi:glycosyltransferase involved in cell wall biosynthesis
MDAIPGMNVLHVIPSLSVKEGGPSFAVKTIAEALVSEGVKVTIATTEGAHAPVIGDQLSVIREEPRRESAPTERRGYKIVSFRRNFEAYKVSFGLTRWLRTNIKEFDLVHIHALFSFSSTMAARIARKKKVPYVVRPLGVLNRWGIENRRRIPKLISFRFVELPILLRAAAIHYTSEAERDEAALLDTRLAEHESAVIPLPIEQRAWSTEQGAESGQRFLLKFPRARGKRVVLFLSRIDRKKGLELLLDAFGVVRQKEKDVALVIAGDGEEPYVRELRERARQQHGARSTEHGDEKQGDKEGKEKEEAIIWTGHLGGEMKEAALAAADVFVLPSASENFGIAAAESLAAGVPTIVSEEVALSSDIRRYDAGVAVKRDVQQLAGAIDDLLSNRERAAGLAANGRRLAEERYSPEAVGRALHELYQKIIT